MQFFQKDLPPRAEADPDGLMFLAYNMKLNPKRMKKLEKDYTVMKTKEQEEMVELRVCFIFCVKRIHTFAGQIFFLKMSQRSDILD